MTRLETLCRLLAMAAVGAVSALGVAALEAGEDGLKPGIVKMFFDPFQQKEPGGPFDHEPTTKNKYADRGSLAVDDGWITFDLPARSATTSVCRVGAITTGIHGDPL